jgi:hypothetical protein
MLILIEGSQPEFLLREEAEKIGAPADFLSQLVGLGLIVKVGSSAAAEVVVEEPVALTDEYSRFRAAKNFMNVTFVDAVGVGIKSFLYTLKLEKAGTCADLKPLIPDYKAGLAKAMDEAQADVLVKRLNKMLDQ